MKYVKSELLQLKVPIVQMYLKGLVLVNKNSYMAIGVIGNALKIR